MNFIDWSENEIYSFPIGLVTNDQLNNQNFSIANKEIEIRIKIISENSSFIFTYFITFNTYFNSFNFFRGQRSYFLFSRKRRLYGNKFKIFKLRTMQIDAESTEHNGQKNDKRITKSRQISKKNENSI